MGFSKELRARFSSLGPDRLVERGQGCWNCTSWSVEKAQEFYWNKVRPDTLEKALKIALESPLKEKDPRVLAIRKTIPQLDQGLEQAVWGVCAKGKMNADFTHTTGLCEDGWVGAQGASLASLGKPDLLPMELLERQEKVETHGDDEN